jgi:hypothetical protein
VPLSRDAYLGSYIQHELVRIISSLGEPEKALDQLEPLLKIPYYLSPGWLKIDPTFAPLRGNPRFEGAGETAPDGRPARPLLRRLADRCWLERELGR